MSLNGTPDTDYLYNALGERVKKAPVGAPSAATHFHYDRDGKLIAESGAAGGLILEYVWLDGLPIAEFTAGSGGTPPDAVQVDNGDRREFHRRLDSRDRWQRLHRQQLP